MTPNKVKTMSISSYIAAAADPCLAETPSVLIDCYVYTADSGGRIRLYYRISYFSGVRWCAEKGGKVCQVEIDNNI